MKNIEQLFRNNQNWVKSKVTKDPEFFKKLAIEQTPNYLWIGCSDSRVPPVELLGLDAGDVFVHRNIANIIQNDDLNTLSCIQYSIEYLNIEHIIVCGHYGCGGVEASMNNTQLGLMDNWISSIRDVYSAEKETIDSLTSKKEKFDRLVELNVHHQVKGISHLPILQNAWNNNKKLTIYGWVFDISTGHLKDLNCSISSLSQVPEEYLVVKKSK